MSKKMLNGTECFIFQGSELAFTVKDFWSWSSSDLLNNTLRGGLAEYIVAIALDIDTKTNYREDWTSYDLLYKTARIEVKSSAYLQSWNSNRISNIVFSIRPTREWSPEKGYGNELKRHSDLYIFCLLSSKDRDNINPLNLDQWEFYVVPTETLNKHLGEQNSISLKKLVKLHPAQDTFQTLLSTVQNIQSKLNK